MTKLIRWLVKHKLPIIKEVLKEEGLHLSHNPRRKVKNDS